MSTVLVADHSPSAPFRGRPDNDLTEREREITALVCEGLTNVQIGARLYLSPRTVQSHIATAMDKLGVSSRTALAVHAIRRGLVPLYPGTDERPRRRGW